MTSNVAHALQQESYSSPPITIILTIVLLLFFFVGFFSIYFCRCFMENLVATWHLRYGHSGLPGNSTNTTGSGLDPSIIKSFPTFAFSTVKDHRKSNEGLECAICLSECCDEDILRLLTACCHVFHRDCIDQWLESHKTCPVCRRSLDSPEEFPGKCPLLDDTNNVHEENEASTNDGSYRISIKDGDTEGTETEGHQPEAKSTEEKFPRSRSTGHSIYLIRREEDDKYTLRLPEHVKQKIKRGHHAANSFDAFGDYSNNSASNNEQDLSGSSGGNVNKV